MFPSNTPIFANCRACNDVVRIPPGIIYLGEPYCRGCALDRMYEDNSRDWFEPYLDELEHALTEILDADRSVNPWA